MKWSEVKAIQLCLTLCDPLDCSLPGSSVHGKNTGVGSHSILQGIFPTQESNSGFPHCMQILYGLNHQVSPPGIVIIMEIFRTYFTWIFKTYCLTSLWSWLKYLTASSVGSVQSLSHVWLFVSPWIAACQASLSITNSWSSLRLRFIKSVMPSSHLILCRPLLLLPPIPPSIRVFSNESTLPMRWPKY